MARQYISAGKIDITWTCIKCNAVQTFDAKESGIITYGGCQGHGPEEYCYCGPEQVVVCHRCDCCSVQATIILSGSY